MEGQEKAGPRKRTTLKDVGNGFIILGAAILLVTFFLYFMSQWEETHYGLFSGATHLIFDTAMGMSFLIAGLLLARPWQDKPGGSPADEE